MQEEEGVLVSIANHLDFKNLARLCASSKTCMKFLAAQFARKAHPHALETIAQRIVEERKRTPYNPFTEMRVRDASFIVFIEKDEEGNGSTTTFWVRVEEDAVRVTTTYTRDERYFSEIMDHRTAIITLDTTANPMRSGTVMLEDDRSSAVVFTNGLDPALVLGWCPLVL